jgi:hypothetical protein
VKADVHYTISFNDLQMDLPLLLSC